MIETIGVRSKPYVDTVMQTIGLKAYWPLKLLESGVLRDLCGFASLTPTGTLPIVVGLRSKLSKGSMDLNGTTEYASAPSLDWDFGTNTLSFEVWCSFDTMGVTGARRTLIGSSNAASKPMFEVGGGPNADEDGNLLIAINGTNIRYTDNLVLTDLSRPYHIVYTRSGPGGGTHGFYVDGHSVNQRGGGGTTNFTSGAHVLLLGARTTALQFHDGRMSDVAIYNRALTAEEVALHCRIGRGF